MIEEPLNHHVDGRLFSLQFENKRVKLGLSTREKGVSVKPYATFNMGYHVGDQKDSVTKNREILAEDLGSPLTQWVFGEQIHSTQIERVTSREAGRGAKDLESVIPKADGLYTTDPGLMLGAVFADCVPLFFIASDGSTVGMAHAGWRGTVGEIGGKMIREWRDHLGILPNDVTVIVGPSIGACCYEVDDRVVREIQLLSEIDHSNLAVPTTPGHYQLDLQNTNKRILEKYGVRPSNIHISQYCTSCRTDLFYSHRKEMGQTGRMIGYIGIDRE